MVPDDPTILDHSTLLLTTCETSIDQSLAGQIAERPVIHINPRSIQFPAGSVVSAGSIATGLSGGVTFLPFTKWRAQAIILRT